MNERQAEYLLLEYPAMWNAMQERREQILDASGCGEAYHCGMGGGGGHSDRTYKTAARLVALDEEKFLVRVVREWLSVEMDPADRAFLLLLWRGRSPAEIDRRDGQIGSARQRLKRMATSLIQFVGRACGGHGAASAASLRKFRPD